MTDKNRAYEIENGIIINDANGDEAFFLTGGASSPVGLDLPVNTVYLQADAAGILYWRKFSTGVNDWRQLSAKYKPSNNFNPQILGYYNTKEISIIQKK